MYRSYREQLSKEIANAFDAALSGPFSLFIDDRPTGTGKTWQLPHLTRIAEKHGIKRSFILTPQKEQRDELCSRYFLQHYQKDEVIVISADGELFAREAVWTDAAKQLISSIGLGDLIPKIDRQISRHKEGEKEFKKNSSLENEKAGIIESERILGNHRTDIWRHLTKLCRYDPKKRCFLNRETKERMFTPAEEATLRRLFPMELDETGQYKVIIMTFQKNLHGISKNTFDNLFFSSDITKDSAIFIDESDEFYKSILTFLVDRAKHSDVSLIELVEYIYRFISKYSNHTQKISENTTVGEAAVKIRKDIAALLKEYGLFAGKRREHIRNLKLELKDDGSIMIVQYSGYRSDFGKHMCICSPDDPSRPAVIHSCTDHSNSTDLPFRIFVEKALRIVDRTAGFLRSVAYKLFDLSMLTDEEAIVNALSTMQFRDTFLDFMLSIIIPEKIRRKLSPDKKSTEIDPFRTGITITRFEDDLSHEALTRIRTLYIKMLPAYWMRAMIRNAGFVMLISATARKDAMNDFPRRYISYDDEGNNICYELSPESRKHIQTCINDMKKIQYGNTRQRVFISPYSSDCIYDTLTSEQSDGKLPELFPFGVSSLSNEVLLKEGGCDNLAFIIQQMVDVIRYRRSVGDDTYVHEIYLTKGFSVSEIEDVIRKLKPASKDFASLFEGIIIGCIKAGNISFQSKEIMNCRTDNIHIRNGQKVFIISAYVSGGRGYDHTVYNDSDGKTYNISGISCKRPAYMLPGVTANAKSDGLLTCACNLINGGYISDEIEKTYRILSRRLAGSRAGYARDFLPNDDLSPYKQTENSILSQTVGRFRMDSCADITTIHIDQNILTKDRCLKQIQFEGRMAGYEMNLVLDAADDFYRNQFSKESAEYEDWNRKANVLCRQYTKCDLPEAKNQADLRSIKKYAAKMEAMKIASLIPGSPGRKTVQKWLSREPRLQKGFPIRITKKDVTSFVSLFWRERLAETAIGPDSISKILYEPLDFLSDIMPEGAGRIRGAFAPLFDISFRDEVQSGERSFSISEQGAGLLKGEIGERFAEEIFRYVIGHGAYSECRVYPQEERLTRPFIYQYEDFDGILAPNIFWDAKNVHDDLLLLAPDERVNESQESTELSFTEKDPGVLRSAMKNKISRMPAGQMNYLIYFSTRFIGKTKPPKFYRPTKSSPLGRLCRETGRDVTVIVISSLFTEEDAGMTAAQKHRRIMSVIGRKVFDRILKETEESRT